MSSPKPVPQPPGSETRNVKNQPATPPVCEVEVDFLARAIIAQHGPDAALAAEHHLDQLVKRSSSRCDIWTAVIDAIHSYRCCLDADGATASGPDQLRLLAAMGG
jgi:hypothetical protein